MRVACCLLRVACCLFSLRGEGCSNGYVHHFWVCTRPCMGHHSASLYIPTPICQQCHPMSSRMSTEGIGVCVSTWTPHPDHEEQFLVCNAYHMSPTHLHVFVTGLQFVDVHCAVLCQLLSLGLRRWMAQGCVQKVKGFAVNWTGASEQCVDQLERQDSRTWKGGRERGRERGTASSIAWPPTAQPTVEVRTPEGVSLNPLVCLLKACILRGFRVHPALSRLANCCLGQLGQAYSGDNNRIIAVGRTRTCA